MHDVGISIARLLFLIYSSTASSRILRLSDMSKSAPSICLFAIRLLIFNEVI